MSKLMLEEVIVLNDEAIQDVKKGRSAEAVRKLMPLVERGLILKKSIKLQEKEKEIIKSMLNDKKFGIQQLEALEAMIVNLETQENDIALFIAALEKKPTQEKYKLLRMELENLNLKLYNFSKIVKEVEMIEEKDASFSQHILKLDRKVVKIIQKGMSAMRKAEESF